MKSVEITNLINEIEKSFDYSKFNNCNNSIRNSTNCVDCCKKRFYAGMPIKYECAQFLKVYVMRYLPVHIYENLLAFRETPQDVFNLIDRCSKVRLLSLGGGPGSDIVAFKEYLEEQERSKIVLAEIVRVDREEKWNEMAEKVINNHKFNGVNYNHTNILADVLSDFIDESKYNFISMSYILSELGSNMKSLAKNLLFSVNDPSVIVINDRDERAVENNANILFNELGVSKSNIHFSKDRRNCGVEYRDDIRETFKPKLSTNSIRYTAIIHL
jgi:hypothetical protein